MPYKIEQIKLAGTKNDKRAKLTQEQREAIVILAREGYSQRKLAVMFNVSRRLIQSILHPPNRAKPKQRPQSYWTEAKRKCRQRKMKLYKAGKIKFEKNHKLLTSKTKQNGKS